MIFDHVSTLDSHVRVVCNCAHASALNIQNRSQSQRNSTEIS